MMHGRFSRRESYLGRKTREMVPMAPGFFGGRKTVGYWPYIRDVLIPAGKARAHFSLGDYQDSSGTWYFKELATNSYPDGTAGAPNYQAVVSPSGTPSRSASSSGGPISGRGYFESTSSTASPIAARLLYTASGDYTLKDYMWFALAYWPTNPQVANSFQHNILSYKQSFPDLSRNWPMNLYHASGSLNLILNINNEGDYTPDIVLNAGTLTLGAWNHIVIWWASTSAPNNEVGCMLNGVEYTTTRNFVFPNPFPGILGLQLLSAVPNGGGAYSHRALGRIAELTYPNAYDSASMITPTQRAELWAAFQTGV